MVAIPFEVQIPENEVIGDLDRQIIREEISGVLNWALAGAKAYLAAGRLDVPKSLAKITADYRESCDLFGQWFQDHVKQADGARLASGEAYRAFVSFCHDEGVKAPPHVGFSLSMGDRGFKARKRTRGKRYFDGLQLRNDLDDDLDEDLIG